MWRTLKDLSLGIFLLLGASALLLLSDLPSRQHRHQAAAVPVAILQFASNPLFQEVTQGITEALAAHGYRDGEKIRLKVFNPEADIATANLIGRRVADGTFKLAITASTVCLQAVANANRSGNVTQVFCAVSDPLATGVGIKKLDSIAEKPPHLTGIGTLQPVEEIFRIAKKLRPELKTVGVVWNPAEANSEACTKRARAICKELDIDLLEASVESTSNVREAAASLTARRVEAFWTGGDATVGNALETLVAVAKQARIPIFSNIGGQTKAGVLFDVGANYHQVGYRAGEIAAEILAGTRSAAEIPIANFVPQTVQVNLRALAELREPWSFPDDFLQSATVTVDKEGRLVGASASSPAPIPVQKHRISVISFLANIPAEETMRGLLRGFEKAGWKDGVNYTLTHRCAQGDMAVLTALFAATELDSPDVIITLSTPTLQTAIKRAKGTPVVFTLVSDPFIAGAGTTDEEHLPGITGSYIRGRYDGMAELIHTHFPHWKRIGSLVAPVEDNSVHDNQRFARELEKYGLELVNMPINQATEVSEAAAALCLQNIDGIAQVAGNLTTGGFPAIAEAARKARVPIFGFVQDSAKKGAALVLARDYVDSGEDAARLAIRILRGESASHLPFSPPTKTVIIANPANAKAQGFELPPALLKQADTILE